MSFYCYDCGLCFHLGDNAYAKFGCWGHSWGINSDALFKGCHYAVCKECGTLHGIEHGPREEGGAAAPYRLRARAGPIFVSDFDRDEARRLKRLTKCAKIRNEASLVAARSRPQSIDFLASRREAKTSRSKYRRFLQWWRQEGIGFTLYNATVAVLILPIWLPLFLYRTWRDRRDSHAENTCSEEDGRRAQNEYALVFARYETEWPIINELLLVGEFDRLSQIKQRLMTAFVGQQAIFQRRRMLEEELIVPMLRCSHCSAGPESLVDSYNRNLPCPSCKRISLLDPSGVFDAMSLTCGKIFEVQPLWD